MAINHDNIKTLLLHARNLLPKDLNQRFETGHCGMGSIKQFETFFYHTEYELALDELIELGNLNFISVDRPFWEDLLKLSMLMGLEHQTSVCQQRLAG